MDLIFFLQENAGNALEQLANSATKTADHAPVGHFSVLDQLIKGWYIYVPQLIMSIIAVYVIIERALTVNRADKEEANRVLTLATEGLDMLKNVTASVRETLEAADTWCDTFGKPKSNDPQFSETQEIQLEDGLQNGMHNADGMDTQA